MDNMRLVVLTPNKKILDVSQVSEVFFPAEGGILGVLPGHAPLITGIQIGLVVYTKGSQSGVISVAGGVAEISGSSITLLADIAEDAAQIDVERAKKALERAESRLSGKDEQIDVKRAERARLRASIRLEAKEMFSQKAGRSL